MYSIRFIISLLKNYKLFFYSFFFPRNFVVDTEATWYNPERRIRGDDDDDDDDDST